MQQRKTDLHPRPEKTIGSHWLRGGQTLSHTWAMIIEVLKNFSIPGVLLGFLMINVVNHKADDLDQIYGTQAAIVALNKHLPVEFRPKEITIKDRAGNEYNITYEQFDTLPVVHDHVKRYQWLLFVGFVVWSLIMLAIISASSILFVKHGAKKVEDHIIRGQEIVSLRDLVRVIRTYNIKQLNEINFATLVKLGFPRPNFADKHEMRMGFWKALQFYITYASMALRDAFHFVKTEVMSFVWEHQFYKAELAAPGANRRVISPAKRELLERQGRGDELELADAAPSVDRSLARRKAALKARQKVDAELSLTNPLDRRFRASKAGFTDDETAILDYMNNDKDAIYRLLVSEEWRDQKLTTAARYMLKNAQDLADKNGLKFFTSPSAYPFPKIIQCPYPYEAERQHTLVVGGTGSGKTVAINTLIDSIKERGDKAIIYDPEGDFIKVHYDPKRDKILNPFDKRTVHWSPFLDMKDKTDWQSAAADLFADNSSEPYWTMVPREIYSTVGHNLQLLYEKLNNGKKPSIAEFIRWLNADHKTLYALIENTSAGRQLGETSGGRVESLRSVISNVTAVLEHLQGSEPNFSIKKWVNDPEERGLLFIVAPDDVAASMKPLISHWCSLATTALLSRQEDTMNQPTWIILDEFGTLQVDNLADATTRLRKFNGRVVLGIQSISQLQDAYGDKKAQTVMGQMSNLLILKLNDTETAKYFSELIGDREARRKDESVTFGAAQMRDAVSIAPKDQLERIVLPEELKNLPVCHGYIKFSPGRDGPFPFAPVKYAPLQRKEISVRCEKIDRSDSIDRIIPDAAKQTALEAIVKKMMSGKVGEAKADIEEAVTEIKVREKTTYAEVGAFTQDETEAPNIFEDEDGTITTEYTGTYVHPGDGVILQVRRIVVRSAAGVIIRDELRYVNDDGQAEVVDFLSPVLGSDLKDKDEEREKLAGAGDAPDGIDGSRMAREVSHTGIAGLDQNLTKEQERVEKLRQKEVMVIEETPQGPSDSMLTILGSVGKVDGTQQTNPLIDLQTPPEPTIPDDDLRFGDREI